MIDKKSIMKMANDVFHRSQGYPDKRLLHPQREWGIGLLVFAVAVIAGSILVANIFVQYRGADRIVGDSEESIPRYREGIVKGALELYQARQEKYTQLRGSIIAAPAEAEVASSTQSVATTSADALVDIEDGG